MTAYEKKLRDALAAAAKEKDKEGAATPAAKAAAAALKDIDADAAGELMRAGASVEDAVKGLSKTK